MKVLQLGKFYPIRGGVEKVMWDLTRGLSRSGIHCDMLCATLPSDGIDTKDADLYDKEQNCFCMPGGGRVFMVPALAKKAATMLSPAMIGWLRRHRSEYDIIHIHHPDPMAALALRMSGFSGKVVLHWHSDILSQKLLLAFYRPLQSWLIRRANRIVGTTPVYIKDSPYLQKVQDKCSAVPIGIEPVAENRYGAETIKRRFAGKRILLSIGRLVQYKGYNYLIKAAKYLPDDCRVVIGGSGPLKDELESLIDRERLRDRVSLIGYVLDEELPAWFTACDAFVLCSTMKTEAFGIVQIEAMSIGKPVIATRIPASGVSWVNCDGISGRNAEPGDAKSLACAITDVLENKEKYGKGARQLFGERYTFENMINQIISIYETLD